MQGWIFPTSRHRPTVRQKIRYFQTVCLQDTLKRMTIKSNIFKLLLEWSSQPYLIISTLGKVNEYPFSTSIHAQNTHAHTQTSNSMIMLATRYIFTRTPRSPWWHTPLHRYTLSYMDAYTFPPIYVHPYQSPYSYIEVSSSSSSHIMGL